MCRGSRLRELSLRVTAAGWAPVPHGRASDEARLLRGSPRSLLSFLQNVSQNAGGLQKVSKMREVTWKKPRREENAVCFERAEPRPLGRGWPAPAAEAASPSRDQAGQVCRLSAEPRCEGESHRASLLLDEGAAGVAREQKASDAVHSQDVRAAGRFDLILFEGFLGP